MVSAGTVFSHLDCARPGQCALDVARGLLDRVYATLRLGGSAWSNIHRVVGASGVALWCFRHLPPAADSRGGAPLVADGGFLHASPSVLLLLRNFSAQAVPFSLDMGR